MSTRKILKEFEEIYEKTYHTTLKYVICKCSNLDDVNDIVQETYIEFYRKLKENNQIQDEQAFIIGIARNRIMKYISKKSKIKTISIFQEREDEEITFDIDAGIDIEAEMITKQNIDEIWKYIKEQNIDTAKIFYLYFVLEMTLNEIATELEIKESTVKSIFYRMLKKLKRIFGGERFEKE